MRSLHLADALLFGINVSFASHILLAQQGIRLLRQAPTPYLNGGSRLRPRADQTRCTVAGDTPTFLAIVRHDQCVCPSGLECRVSSTISSILSCGIVDLRPRPSRTLPSLASPSSAKRSRQARTVEAFTPTRAAIRVFATPSAASSSASAR